MSYVRAIQTGSINKLYAEDGAAHNWYRFVLSFPPHLVRSYLQRFGLNEDSRVLDPFCGTGTTLVESKKLGVEGVGIEAHPMTYFASNVKMDWTPAPSDLIRHARIIAATAKNVLEAVSIRDEPLSPSPFIVDLTNAHRTLEPETFKLLLTNSISPLPLHKTLVLLDTIEVHRDERFYRHERLALAKTLIDSIGNLHFGPEVGVGQIKQDAAVINPWLAAVESVARDLHELSEFDDVKYTVHCADARESNEFLEPESIDAVITSPPYPNEKDYTRTTRLESVLLGFIKNRADLQTLKRRLMRSNTRTVYKGDRDDDWIADHAEVNRIATEIEARRLELGKTSGFERLYARVVKLYFGGMARHLANLRPALRQGANLAYIVGDQASYFRVTIRTGNLLADIADRLGYEVVARELFRSRLSTTTKEYLREEAIILRWRGVKPRFSKTIFQASSEGERHMPDEKKTRTIINRYAQIIERVFHNHYTPDSKTVRFTREEFVAVAKELGINLPKNLGDIIYSFRYRVELPASISRYAPTGERWIIRPTGRGIYTFALTSDYDLTPNPNYDKIKIPDATPGLVAKYSFNDEQALLAKLRYNRLIDIFSGATCYSLQNHLRTFLTEIGQVETDEVYVGVDKRGIHHIFPVQAKGGKDKLSIVQIEQDFALCASRFPDLVPHPIGAQFMADDTIVLFEFNMTEDGVKISTEKHYKLVQPGEITPELLEEYRNLATE
ncbi:MAG: hypothetical protein NVSMB56_04590 [Pyrinomonadaceae bacterium]